VIERKVIKKATEKEFEIVDKIIEISNNIDEFENEIAELKHYKNTLLDSLGYENRYYEVLEQMDLYKGENRMLNCWHNGKQCRYKDGYECKLNKTGACQWDVVENKLWQSDNPNDKIEAIKQAEESFRLKMTEARLRR